MTTYKQPRLRSRRSRILCRIAQMDADNRREQGAVTMKTAERDVRARLQDQYPDDAPEETESRVAKVVAGGAKPTTAPVSKPDPRSAEVHAARRAERKRLVRSNRSTRRQDGGR